MTCLIKTPTLTLVALLSQDTPGNQKKERKKEFIQII